MLISMTGFGRANTEYKEKKIIIDIKTLNSKSTDITTRIPNFYREKEIALRKLLASELQRGKIDFCMFVEINGGETSTKFSDKIILNYYNQLKTLCDTNNIPISNDILSSIIRMPDVMTTNSENLNDEEWEYILISIKQAIEECKNFRQHEGNILAQDIISNLNSITELLSQVPQYEAERINVLKERLNHSLKEIVDTANIDANRYEQEIIFYLEKFDINEEKVRLKKHCDYFLQTLNSENFAGKKLGFIAQEMGREINTLGAKANHVEIQKLVIMMKDELEKIKEQVLNAL
ncbi:MAG: YicC family protein [Bacteroidales bacterium]|jgi:uncharacterized protein (TIGR00255 family)|nr:YicC family protein [Bacteroidales bacterium]MCK9498007.1 YicC family protein [Bacteroidales bacterium]MDY0314225.1 YicC/YloC family endoribonuclease [Bacteroidales bacterium]NLB85483.1 YicC family protein [Bacteroidales bacterium]